MRVLVIGGVRVDKTSSDYGCCLEELSNAARLIGHSLVSSGHELVVCSPFPDSADFHVLEGSASLSGANIAAHIFYPAERTVMEAITTLRASVSNISIHTNPCAAPIDIGSKESWKHSWLLAQLSAMEYADVVLTIGGRSDGSMSFLLPLAEMRSKPILPYAFLGGLSEQILDKRLPFYRDRLGSKLDLLLMANGAEHAGDLCAAVATKVRMISNPKFFLSYAKARPAEADFLETVLRRRQFIVFRDDGEFVAGISVQSQIIEFIDKSDIFIAVWCQEYACSPWCFDELEYALARERSGQLTIWIVPVDGTRIVPPGARDKLRFDVFSSREQLEGRLLKEIERLTR